MLFVMNRGSFDGREYQFKNTEDEVINIKVQEGFNVVWPIIPTYMDEKIFLLFLKTHITRLDY